jgi:hypothetical protein
MPGNRGGPPGPADPAPVVGPDGWKGAKVGRGGPALGTLDAKGAWGSGRAGAGTGGRFLTSGCRCGGYQRPSDASHHPGGAPTSDMAGCRRLAHGCAHTGLSAGPPLRLSTRDGTSHSDGLPGNRGPPLWPASGQAQKATMPSPPTGLGTLTDLGHGAASVELVRGQSVGAGVGHDQVPCPSNVTPKGA